MIIGGMPAIVNKFVTQKNYSGTLQMQKQILLDYEEDIRKYAEGLDQTKIASVYRSVPVQLAKENKKFQVSAASYGWLLASVKMSWYIKYCGWKKLSAPVLLFQAERDDFVSVNALRKFAEKINHRGITSCEYVYLPGTRHETYRSDDRTMEMYLDKIMKFLDSCSGEMFSHYEVLRE
jgi:alpha-beta hydrolase superfamily lysophospholipase